MLPLPSRLNRAYVLSYGMTSLPLLLPSFTPSTPHAACQTAEFEWERGFPS